MPKNDGNITLTFSVHLSSALGSNNRKGHRTANLQTSLKTVPCTKANSFTYHESPFTTFWNPDYRQ